jgi:hypothetical protein
MRLDAAVLTWLKSIVVEIVVSDKAIAAAHLSGYPRARMYLYDSEDCAKKGESNREGKEALHVHLLYQEINALLNFCCGLIDLLTQLFED